MPCRSRRASICFFPRDRCARSRRASGASGGGAGLGKIVSEVNGLRDDSAGFTAAGPSAAWELACAFVAPGFFRSGLVSLATLSQSARSSSLKLRLRRAAAGKSGGGAEERFLGCGGGGEGGRGASRPGDVFSVPPGF